MMKTLIGYSRALWHKGMQSALAMLPGACEICRNPDRDVVCSGCLGRIIAPTGMRCSQCGTVLPTDNLLCAKKSAEKNSDLHALAGLSCATGPVRCGRCLAERPCYDKTVLVTDYASPQRELILAFKFSQRLHLKQFFSRQMYLAWLESGIPAPDFLVPVPLSQTRLQQRGYNQALELARGINHFGKKGDIRHTGVKAAMMRSVLWPDVLRRRHDTLAQAKLSVGARRKNMANVFYVRSHDIAALKNRHILLIDDVMTSGATLNAAAKSLKRHGVASVTNLVYARTEALSLTETE